MKFELFGRLRDNDGGEEDDSGSDSSTDFNAGLQDSNPMNNMTKGLESTVENMFNQGYSEDEIRKELSGQYSEQEINNAVNRVVTSEASGNNDGPDPMTPYQGGDTKVSPVDEGFSPEDQQQNQQTPPPAQGPAQQSQPPLQNQGQDSNSQQGGIPAQEEELIETIVAENFERVREEFKNAYSEIDELKQKQEELEERVHDLEVRDDEDQTQFVEKMNDLEEDINSYQSRIGGLEKAFQQVLPSLVDNVRQLTSLVQEIKQERGIETESNVTKDDIEDIDVEDL